MNDEITELKLAVARMEGSIINLHGKMDQVSSAQKAFHDHVAGPLVGKVDKHHDDITKIKTHGVWISGFFGVASSWLGLKLFGKG